MGVPEDDSDIDATLFQGKGEGYASATERRRPELDGAVVELDDLLAQRHPDAGALILVPPVQSLEDDEHLLRVLRRDTDAVVRHVDSHPLALHGESDAH